MELVNWLHNFGRRLSTRRSPRCRRGRARSASYLSQAAEVLEVRALLSGTIAWDGGGDGTSWNDANNWMGDATPGPSDDVTIDVANSNPTIVFGGGLAEINSLTYKDTLAITGGTLQIDGNSTIANLQVSGGTFANNGMSTVTSQMQWYGGDVRGTGTLTVQGDGSADPDLLLGNGGSANWQLMDGETFVNLGQAVLNVATGRMNLYDGSTFVNQGHMDVIVSGFLDFQALGLPGGSFVNAAGAEFIKSQYDTDVAFSYITGGVAFNNDGLVDLQQGELQFLGGGTSNGSFHAAAGTLLDLGANGYPDTHLTATSQITGAGLVRFGGAVSVAGLYDVTGETAVVFGSVDFTGTVVNSGSVLISGATVYYNTGSTVHLSSLILGGGLRCAEDVIVSGFFDWQGGGLLGSGSLTSAGTMQISNPYIVEMNGGTLNNAGTAVWLNGQIRTSNGSVINNLVGATFEARSTADTYYDGNGDRLTFNNAGTFRKAGDVDTGWQDAGTGTAFDGTFVNTGTVEALVGTISFDGGFTQTAGQTVLNGGSIASSSPLDIQGGLLDGSGTIFGGVNNAGTTSPGFSPGLITISDNYTQQP